jgi:hypothetical protein
VSQESLPSAADLDLVIQEREMVVVNVRCDSEKQAQGQDNSQPILYPLWKSSCARVALLIVALLFGSSVLRANSVPVVLNNAGSNVMGGVYVGPYNFTVGGQSMQLVCDDFLSTVVNGETWNAVTSTYPSLSNVKFSGLVQYKEIGYLVQQMWANISNPTVVGYISWAIWDVFTPGVSGSDPYGTLTSAQQTQINNWLTQAINNYSTGNYSNLIVYTPVPGSQLPAYLGSPQEYIGIIPAPEPASFLLLALGVAGLLILSHSKRFKLATEVHTTAQS